MDLLATVVVASLTPKAAAVDGSHFPLLGFLACARPAWCDSAVLLVPAPSRSPVAGLESNQLSSPSFPGSGQYFTRLCKCGTKLSNNRQQQQQQDDLANSAKA